MPGLLLQVGSIVMSGIMNALTGGGSGVAAIVFFSTLVVGTGLLIVGLAYYATAKGQSAAWCVLGFLGIIGLIILAALPDRHANGLRRLSRAGKISDVPTASSIGFYCLGCNYQLNATIGTRCPECGRPFDPDDLTTVQVEGVERATAPWTGRWSLILGITGLIFSITMLCGPILGVLGVAFGHTARSTIAREKRPGAGIALAGLITSYSAIAISFLFIFVGFILPAIVSSISP